MTVWDDDDDGVLKIFYGIFLGIGSHSSDRFNFGTQ